MLDDNNALCLVVKTVFRDQLSPDKGTERTSCTGRGKQSRFFWKAISNNNLAFGDFEFRLFQVRICGKFLDEGDGLKRQHQLTNFAEMFANFIISRINEDTARLRYSFSFQVKWTRKIFIVRCFLVMLITFDLQYPFDVTAQANRWYPPRSTPGDSITRVCNRSTVP